KGRSLRILAGCSCAIKGDTKPPVITAATINRAKVIFSSLGMQTHRWVERMVRCSEHRLYRALDFAGVDSLRMMHSIDTKRKKRSVPRTGTASLSSIKRLSAQGHAQKSDAVDFGAIEGTAPRPASDRTASFAFPLALNAFG